MYFIVPTQNDIKTNFVHKKMLCVVQAFYNFDFYAHFGAYY